MSNVFGKVMKPIILRHSQKTNFWQPSADAADAVNRGTPF